MNDDKNIENKKHVESIYKDKSINLLKIYIAISFFSGLTYLIGIFVYNSFDFGLIFELISFIFVLFALTKIKQNKMQTAKRNTIIAMFPLGWLIIYDFIHLLINIKEVLLEVTSYYLSYDRYLYYLEPYLFDVTLVVSIILLYRTYLSLCKADGSQKNDNYVDTFYDTL